MKAQDIKIGIEKIASTMALNREYLIELDQKNGDGDLGISMADGFNAINISLKNTEIVDLGILFNRCGDIFNEAAPSSLGTVISFIFKGMARNLKGMTECSVEELGNAIINGINNVKEKTGSEIGDKTILDSLYPAANTLISENTDQFKKAAEAAREGSNNTINMKAKWGRAAYYNNASVGIIDGGSVVGALIFEALAK